MKTTQDKGITNDLKDLQSLISPLVASQDLDDGIDQNGYHVVDENGYIILPKAWQYTVQSNKAFQLRVKSLVERDNDPDDRTIDGSTDREGIIQNDVDNRTAHENLPAGINAQFERGGAPQVESQIEEDATIPVEEEIEPEIERSIEPIAVVDERPIVSTGNTNGLNNGGRQATRIRSTRLPNKKNATSFNHMGLLQWLAGRRRLGNMSH